MEKTAKKKKLQLRTSPSPTKGLTSKKANLTTAESSSSPKHSMPNVKKVVPVLPIPGNYGERIEFIKRIYENESLLQYCTSAPLRSTSQPEDIGKYFLSKQLSHIEICAALLLYMNLNFQVDTENLTNKKPPDQSAETIFKSGLGLSEGLSKLYKALCSGADIKVEIINGLLKKKGYKQGDSLSKHSWCAINMGKYYFVDVFLSIGDISENRFNSKLRPFYFLTPPEYLIDTHRPEIDKWQSLNKTLTVKQFSLKPTNGIDDFFNSVFDNKIRLGSFPYPEIAAKDSSIVLKLGMEDMAINASIESVNKVEATKEINFDEKSQMFSITIDFPSNGEYFLTILGKSVTSTELNFKPILHYKIKVTITNQKKKKKKERSASPVMDKSSQSRLNTLSSRSLSLTNKRSEKRLRNSSSEIKQRINKKCYDNKGAFLYEPKTQILKIGQEVKFRVKVKDAINVFVLDGKRWTYLKKREEDVYEGAILIQFENVVICSLKKSNVYTEIFEFFAIKH